MDTLSPEKSCTNRQRVIEELVKGQDLATQLQILVENPNGDHGSISVKDLAGKILRSITEALSVMNSCESDEVCQNPATTQVGSPSCGDLRFVDSSESIMRPAVKDRRCYKRRKTLDSWMIVSPSMEDGYAWRKYGLRKFLFAKFQRDYYMCVHKFDEGCQTTKQVQWIDRDPIMYKITYFGHHTCRETLPASQNISDSDSLESFLLYLLYFGSNITSHPSIEEEYEEEEYEEEADEDLLSLNSIASPRLMPLESSCWEYSDSFDDSLES